MTKNSRSKVLMPLSISSIERIPPDAKGIYAFWNPANSKCIYVGQAKHQPIKDRLRSHWRKTHSGKLNLWIQAQGSRLGICYLPLDADRIDRYETRLIRAWSPEANVQKQRR